MPNSASGQKYASGFDVTNPLWSRLEYQLSTGREIKRNGGIAEWRNSGMAE